MPKPRSRRGRRGRGRRPLPPPAAPLPRPSVATEAVAAPRAAERAHEPSVTRFSARDYSYVRREIQRIVLLAALIIVAIIVLSFFLP